MTKKTKIYADYLEETALKQFESAMEQDFSVQGALMADAHTGYSLPIGGVVATDGVIVPSWIGYDIGCGMCAYQLDIAYEAVVPNRQAIYDAIYEAVPVGFNINPKPSPHSTQLTLQSFSREGSAIAYDKKMFHALGSLGGGNHFIEIGTDEFMNVWVIIHSGSRGVGHGIAQHYMRLASPTGKATEGHFGFDVGSLEGQSYINDMNACLQFALDNRLEIMRRVVSVLYACSGISTKAQRDVGLDGLLINRNHNHAEERDGLWIHRKGATHAEGGMLGVIPGNMRDGSFIVGGLGNPDSLYSSSHGAGRVLGRKEAKRVCSLEQFKGEMRGITAKVGHDTLDESPMAYKNIFDVMALQEDLVETISHVKPIINVKA